MTKYFIIFFILFLLVSYLKRLHNYKFIWPVKGRISSGYGYRRHPISGKIKFHKGIDIAAPKGRKVMAINNGKIVAAGWNGAYGKFIKIWHKNNFASKYAHLSNINIKKGQYVKKGQKIGKIGSTGKSTGNHLHFEIIYKNKTVNPRLYLPPKFFRNAKKIIMSVH